MCNYFLTSVLQRNAWNANGACQVEVQTCLHGSYVVSGSQKALREDPVVCCSIKGTVDQSVSRSFILKISYRDTKLSELQKRTLLSVDGTLFPAAVEAGVTGCTFNRLIANVALFPFGQNSRAANFVFAQIIFTCTITLINAQADSKI